jgi:glycine/D-amino acid oxidase-like deaminating enzyme
MEVYEEDITGFNRESEGLWQALQSQSPELFNNTNLRQGIVRIYATEEQWKNAILKETQIGALVRIISPEQLCSEQPALLPSVMNGEIVGAIEVKGFSLGVHDLACNLLRALESRGATLRFDTEAIAFERSGEEISGVQVADGVLRADHYVVCPGAYGERLIADLGIENQIHSVLGAWYMLRNEAPLLSTSMKYTRSGIYADGAAEGANILVGEEDGESVVWVSSGHAYIGKDARSAGPDEIEQIFLGVRDTIRALFPRQFSEIERAGEFSKQDIRYCVRPWARECLGIFAAFRAVNGKVVVTGAHNTGGFAQAPSVGKAVLECLRGKEHTMHRLYHPRRTVIFEDALARQRETTTAYTMRNSQDATGEVARKSRTRPPRGIP